MEEVVIGSATPLSGPFSTGGQDMMDGVKLAIKDAIQQDLVGDIRHMVEDSGTNPTQAREVAQQHINNGAHILIGTLSGATSEAVSQLGRSEEVIVVGSSGNLLSSGPNCHPYWFPLNCSGRTMMMAGVGYCLRENLGTSVYQISSDFLWPQDMVEQGREYVIPEFGGNHLGNQFVPFGASDYSQALSNAREADPDILTLNAYGTDLQKMMNQAFEFGFFEDTVITTPQSDITIAEGYNPEARAHENFVQGMEWYHGYNSTATQEFTQKFRDEYARAPAWTAALCYNHTMTYIEAVAAAGTAEPSAVVPEMEDRPLALQLWGEEKSAKIRACNHRPTNPSMTLKGKAAGSFEGRNFFDVVNIMENPDAYMIPCDQTGCEM